MLEIVPGSLPKDGLSTATYPGTFAWRDKYNNALEAAKQKQRYRDELNGPAAAHRILGSSFAKRESNVEPSDPIAQTTGLKKRGQIGVWPADTIITSKDHENGEHLALNRQEVVTKVRSQSGVAIRVHMPRWNHNFQPAKHTNGA